MVKGLLTTPLVQPLMDWDRRPSLLSPTSFQQAEICEAFREVVLWLLRVENIFDFSQTTFNLALSIFSRLIVTVKVGELWGMVTDGWVWKLTFVSCCYLTGEPSQVLKPNIINKSMAPRIGLELENPTTLPVWFRVVWPSVVSLRPGGGCVLPEMMLYFPSPVSLLTKSYWLVICGSETRRFSLVISKNGAKFLANKYNVFFKNQFNTSTWNHV